MFSAQTGRRSLLVLGFSVLVALGGCTSSTTPSVPLDQEFTLAPSELVVIKETLLGIRFIGVLNDSRCPADAICIVGGDAQVRIQVNPNHGAPVLHDLHTGSNKPVVHDGHTITLVRVEPYPFSGRTIRQEDYRVTLRVTR